MEKKRYDCSKCYDKRCENCGNPNMDPRARDVTDSYRQKVKGGYYSSGITSYKDEKGNTRYCYTKPGE